MTNVHSALSKPNLPNPFLVNVPILYPLKTPETIGFLVFSVVIK